MSKDSNNKAAKKNVNSAISTEITAPYKKDLFTRIVSLSPKFLLLLLILPVLGGLVSVLLPAFSWVPALEQTTVSLQGFNDLWQTPGLIQMVALSIATGLISTLLAFVMTLMILAAFFNRAFWYVFTAYFTVAKRLGIGTRRYISP